MHTTSCELCQNAGGEIVARSDRWRVVLVDDVRHPGFCRVIWNAHVSEMTDLTPDERSELMRTVCQVEAIVRDVMQPDKINLASLGNMVPHLHWHVIPRFIDDAQFPDAIWAAPKRVTAPEVIAARTARLPALRSALATQLEPS